MKGAFILVAFLLAAQQQTFYSAKAQPKPVPKHTAQAVNAIYVVNPNCAAGHSGNASSHCSGGRPKPHASYVPASRPAPRHT